MKTGDDAIYFVSFLDGLQRVLLFTDDFKTAYCASQVLKLRFPHRKLMQKLNTTEAPINEHHR